MGGWPLEGAKGEAKRDKGVFFRRRSLRRRQLYPAKTNSRNRKPLKSQAEFRVDTCNEVAEICRGKKSNDLFSFLFLLCFLLFFLSRSFLTRSPIFGNLARSTQRNCRHCRVNKGERAANSLCARDWCREASSRNNLALKGVLSASLVRSTASLSDLG